MRLFPAVDIQNGRCVRLRRGDFASETVFDDDPVKVALYWSTQGARFLHVVDLDGAREGTPRNFDIVRRIAEVVPVPVQFGGGVRSAETLRLVEGSGVARVIIGTGALLDEEFLRCVLEGWRERLVVAVDAERGWVKTHGWSRRGGMKAGPFVKHLEQLGVQEIIYTDITRDGMLSGMNIPAIRELARQIERLEIIASGGLTTLDDLRCLKELEPLGVTGVIAGRALYERRFTIAEAHAILAGSAE